MLALFGCDGKTAEERSAENKERAAKKQAKRMEALSRFGASFNAEVVEDVELLNLMVTRGSYSILVEKALIREGDKPIVFWSMVEDVSKSDRGYLVHFHWFSDIHYSLKCQEDHINLILENASEANLFTQFAVVAVIDSVKKIDLMPSAAPNTLKEDSPSIELTSGKTFWATGRCLALKPRTALLPD